MECGKPLFQNCLGCGYDNPSVARYCTECGQSLNVLDKVNPATNTEVVLDKANIAPEQRTERKKVTVLFADIVGSTTLIDGRDAEEALDIFKPVLRAMTEAVNQHGGQVVKELGDGIMAVFGAPISQADHAIRACSSALTMQSAAQDHARRIKRQSNVVIQIRVGINSGSAVVTMAGHLHGAVTDITSPMVHLASRMESTANPGAINLSENSYRRIQNEFDCHALGLKQVKGFSEPISVYTLIRHKIQPEMAHSPKLGRQNLHLLVEMTN